MTGCTPIAPLFTPSCPNHNHKMKPKTKEQILGKEIELRQIKNGTVCNRKFLNCSRILEAELRGRMEKEDEMIERINHLQSKYEACYKAFLEMKKERRKAQIQCWTSELDWLQSKEVMIKICINFNSPDECPICKRIRHLRKLLNHSPQRSQGTNGHKIPNTSVGSDTQCPSVDTTSEQVQQASSKNPAPASESGCGRDSGYFYLGGSQIRCGEKSRYSDEIKLCQSCRKLLDNSEVKKA